MNSFFEIQFVEDHSLDGMSINYSILVRNLIQANLVLMLFEDRLSIDQLQKQLVQEDGTGIIT